MSARLCTTCRGAYVFAPAPATECERCEKFRQVGVIVLALGCDDFAFDYDALDAVATLCLTAPAIARRRHNRELHDEQRAAQRAARDAYAEGRAEGRGDGW